YGERSHQVDVRFTKIIKFGNARLRTMFDLFNIFNANAITNEEYGFGPNYLRPLAILPGRLAKFAFQIDFCYPRAPASTRYGRCERRSESSRLSSPRREYWVQAHGRRRVLHGETRTCRESGTAGP